MLVPCAKHVKIRDVNLRDRTWLRDFSYEDSNGEKVEYKAGDPIGRVMRAWVEALMQFEEAERTKILEHIEIWGQPRAWTDEKISCDVIELIPVGRVMLAASVALEHHLGSLCTRGHEHPPGARHARALAAEVRDSRGQERNALGTRVRVVCTGEGGEGLASGQGDQAHEKLETSATALIHGVFCANFRGHHT